MPSVTRQGDKNTGHELFPPVPLKSGSATVFVNGLPCGRQSDPYEDHTDGMSPPHPGTITGGSSTVFVEGLPIARVDDSVSCGGTVAEGSPDVNAN